jgi:hypothetical protein
MVLRSNAWYEGLVSSKEDEVLRQPEGGTGDPPKEMLDRSAARHSDRRVSSLINIPLWEKAKWTSTAYIWSNWREEEPWIALAFQNKDAGMAIFRELIAKIGKRDEMDRLRVSIITGIQKESPFAYSVLISSNLVLAKDATRPQEVVSVFRINRMGPRNSFSIDTFKARLENTQKYLLLPAYGPDPNGKYTPFVELSIEKNSIRICPAWQIGEHDIDSMGISPDDEPIIPPDVVDAPILRLIERRKQRKL